MRIFLILQLKLYCYLKMLKCMVLQSQLSLAGIRVVPDVLSHISLQGVVVYQSRRLYSNWMWLDQKVKQRMDFIICLS